MTQQLFYENAVPVSHPRHAGWHVEAGSDFSFSRRVNSMPLMAVEFPFAASEYAVVFAGSAEAPMPAVILGVRDNENLFVDAAGTWTGKYVPAFARRYPFVFASSADGATFTLCIDESFAGVNQAGRGAALFDAEGKATAYVQNVLSFLQEYQAQFQRTQQFCRKLKEHNLLEPMQAQITTAKGQNMSLSGFMTVSRDRLKALPGDVLADLAKTDELELVYLHLQSMRNFQSMLERLDKALAPAPAPAAAQAPQEPAAGASSVH